MRSRITVRVVSYVESLLLDTFKRMIRILLVLCFVTFRELSIHENLNDLT